jgi:hypothetical protein
MGYQGARRSRPGADARQAARPSADDPGEPGQGPAPGQLIGPGTGGYRVLEADRDAVSEPQRAPGSGSGAVSGPQPTMDRTPVRGFPPLSPGYQQPPTPPDGFSAWHTPGAPPAGQDAGYAADGGDQVGEDHDPVPPASIAPGPERRSARAARSAGPRRRSSRVRWLVLVAVLIVAGGAYAGYKYVYEPRVNAPLSSPLRLPTNVPGSPGFDQALGKWQHIGTRTQDPQPLTLQQLFPPQFALTNGSSYVRTAAAVTKDCSLAVFGSDLQAALQAGHCTQILRASYISGNGTMMGTVGVANLSSSSAAQKAGQVTGPQEIIAPLAAQKGPTSKLGNGTGVVQAEIKGHYLILMWAEFTSLKSPSTSAQRQQLEQFATNLVTGSANINLSTRMLTGKP